MSKVLHRAAIWLLPLIALLYLAYIAAELDPLLLADLFSARALAIAFVAALLYGAGLYLLAFSWSACLQKFSRNPVSPEAAMQLYAFSTFAKYLPGNVFHYAGRQIAAARLGYGQKAPAQATALEILAHLAAVGLLLLALLPSAAGQLASLLSLAEAQLRPWLAIGALALAAVILLLLLSPRLRQLLPPVDSRLLAYVALLQISFFAITALLGLWLSIAVLNLEASALPLLVFVYLASWLIGFVTPGAPGGLGVREACLVVGLSGLVGTEQILAFAALTRGSFLLGEALFALSGFLLRPSPEVSDRRRPSAPAR